MPWSSGLSTNEKFDTALAVLIPVAILFVCYRFSGNFRWSDFRELLSLTSSTAKYGPFSLNRAYQSYSLYAKMSEDELLVIRSSYASLGRAHKRLGYNIGYPTKLDRLRSVTTMNKVVTDEIAKLAKVEYDLDGTVEFGAVSPAAGDLARVRESLKHFVRDWSMEGTPERAKIFKPIFEALNTVEPDERSQMSVLVPGCGLARLAWEISELGFNTTANELSHFMMLAFRFLASPETTTTPEQHKIFPYAYWFSHQRSNNFLFRSVKFPDVVPRLSERFKLVENDFLKLASLPAVKSSSSDGNAASCHVGYDYVVTLFFIDTSLNVFATVEQIFALLKPGGAWINLGPLLWTGGGKTKVELSLEEVIAVAEATGFIDDPSIERQTVECEYTSDPLAMMRWIYRAEFWVMRKPKA
ncbi:hypothetical protein AMATHDRAFT_46563 [Amanita thiersii Skay4041]|uniref:Uncharacterized protein n=1 Tax=Amanita thiersii Skay4041 TaxID=703135 RepID=A0A2A9NWQ8_9AGAR|nr:hypothetical protein AMATHDRAFT_46563 [Amanita thiersii Skay4041]